MPRISVMTMIFGGMLADRQMTDESMLRELEEAGFDGVELPLDPLLAKPALKKVYADYVAWSDLDVTCIDAISNLAAGDAGARAKAVDTLRAGIDVAAELKCPLVLSAGSRLTPDVQPEVGRRYIADGLRACLPHAQDAGITIAIEDFGIEPNLQCAAADCQAVLDAAPGTAFVFDTGNFYFRHEDPLNNFDRLAPYTRHVHLKDWAKSEEPDIADVSGVQLGDGIIPNEALVRKFLGVGIDSFSLEVGAHGDRMDATVRDLRRLQKWLAQAKTERVAR